MLRRAGLPLLAAGLVVTLARGQAVRVEASLEPSGRAAETDPIRLVVRVEGADRVGISPPRLPPLENLRVVSGPATSSQFSWVNGRASGSTSFTWVLLAESTGAARVPSVQVRVDAVVHRTEPIAIEIVKGQSAPRGEAAPRGTTGPDVFLQVELGRETAWVGEPIPLTVTLFSSVDVGNVTWRERPSFSGFWVDDIAVDPSGDRYRATVGGRPFNAYPLERKILSPTAPGELRIEPFAAQLQIRRSSGDLFNDFFNLGRVAEIVRKTEPRVVRVRALPQEGRPADFGGAVGSFRQRTSVDRDQVRVHDAVALKVTVEGEGSLRAVAAPRLEVPPDVKVFDPKVSESSSATTGKVASRKTWEWVLVPLTPAPLRIPGVRFPYFDPGVGAYRVAESAPIEVAVLRGEGPGEPASARGDVRLERQDIAFIKPLRGRLSTHAPRVHRAAWFVTLLVLPAVWIPGGILLGRRRARLRHDRGFARAGRARRRAQKRLRAAERRLDAVDGAFHEEVARALVDFVADRFDRPPAGLTYDLVDELLGSRGVDPEQRGRFRACLERCDFARFVPAGGHAGRAEVLAEARRLVDALEAAWR